MLGDQGQFSEGQMMAVWMTMAISAPAVRQLDKTEHYTLAMQRHDSVELVAASPGITLVLPKTTDITADVYHTNGGADIVVGSLGPTSSTFGVYFPKEGRVSITATEKTNLPVFAFTSVRGCRRFYITTKATDAFIADKRKGNDINMTIQHAQRVCLFHVSDENTSVAVAYNTELEYDLLHVATASGNETVVSGVGEYITKGKGPVTIMWTSDTNILSDEFSVKFSSNSTLPEHHANFSIKESLSPLLISEAWPPVTPKRFGEDEHQVHVTQRQRGTMALIGVVAGCGCLICAVLVFLVFAGNGQAGEPQVRKFTNEEDDPEDSLQVLELGLSDQEI